MVTLMRRATKLRGIKEIEILIGKLINKKKTKEDQKARESKTIAVAMLV